MWISTATHSKSRNKSQLPDGAKENNSPPTQASNDTHYDEAAFPSNLHSPPRDNSELITLRNACQGLTGMQCYFHLLRSCFIEYINDPVPDGEIIYAGSALFQYNEQDDTYTKSAGNPTGNVILALARIMNSCQVIKVMCQMFRIIPTCLKN